MTLLHGGPLVEFVTALDTRITYATADNSLTSPEPFLPVVTRINGATDDKLTVLGAPLAPDLNGRRYHLINVGVSASGAQVTRRTPPEQNTFFAYELTQGLSPSLTLLGTGYSFKLNTLNPVALWEVVVLNRPVKELGTISAELDLLSEPTLAALFGITNAEPFATFRRLWFNNRELPLRLGAFLLAVAYRTEERRTGVAA